MRLATILFVLSTTAFASPLPLVSLPQMTANGTPSGTWNMADYKGGVFVFEFFQNFCSACNANAANVDALATKYKDNARVHVVDLSLDGSQHEYQQWFTKHKPNHPVLNDSARKVFGVLDHQGVIPQTFVIDCNGTVLTSTVDVWDQTTLSQIDGAVAEGLQAVCEI